MAQPARGAARLLAALVVAVAVAGLLAQAGFMLREANDELSTSPSHQLRRLLQQADEVIPAGDGYAVTSNVRSDNARYFLYPRARIQTSFTREALERSGVRWVIVTNDARPPALRGEGDWYRIRIRTAAGRLLEVTG